MHIHVYLWRDVPPLYHHIVSAMQHHPPVSWSRRLTIIHTRSCGTHALNIEYSSIMASIMDAAQRLRVLAGDGQVQLPGCNLYGVMWAGAFSETNGQLRV